MAPAEREPVRVQRSREEVGDGNSADVGPNDLAASMRSKDGKPPSAKATNDALAHILATCSKHKVAAGYHCNAIEELEMRIAEGWQFLAIGSELKMMLQGAAAITQKLGTAVKEMAKY